MAYSGSLDEQTPPSLSLGFDLEERRSTVYHPRLSPVHHPSLLDRLFFSGRSDEDQDGRDAEDVETRRGRRS